MGLGSKWEERGHYRKRREETGQITSMFDKASRSHVILYLEEIIHKTFKYIFIDTHIWQ